jgi:hypothetical protein
MQEQHSDTPLPVAETCCCICGRNDSSANEFEFYYGKQGERIIADDKKSPRLFDLRGIHKGHICHRCFTKTHLPIMLAGVFGIIAVLSGSLYMQFTFQLSNYPIALSALIIIIGIGIHQTASIIRKNRKHDLTPMVLDDGSKLLIKYKKRIYEETGCDTFLTPDLYKQYNASVKHGITLDKS